MNRLLSIICICLIWSCNHENPVKQELKINSVEIEILPSFGERSKFLIDENGKSAVIEEDWRFAARTDKPSDTMHFYSDMNAANFKNWQGALRELPMDSSEFHSDCHYLDGWRIKGQINFDDNSKFGLNYQCCKADTVAHQFTESILKELSSTFSSDTIVHEYLYDIYYGYFLEQEPPMDSAEYANRALTKMRIEVFEKHYKK